MITFDLDKRVRLPDGRGKVASLDLTCAVPIIIIPEVYLWRPHQFEEIARILR